MRIFFSKIWFSIFIFNLLIGAVTTIDFETDGDGYTASSTEGSGWTDIFNRTNYDMSSVTENGYYWAAEDISSFAPMVEV